MSVSFQYLERCSAETGFQVDPLEKVVRLGELAANVARHPFLSKVLALKGGTLLNLCFGPPRRLSVDLDFNYIGHIERQKMLDDRPRVEAAVAELAQRGGYRLQLSANAFAGRKFYLLYQSVLGQEDRVEVDLNFLFRLPFAGTKMRILWQPGDLDRPRVGSVGDTELLVGKLLALLDRCAARDVWDVANLPEVAVEVLKSSRLRVHFIALVAILNHPLPTYTRDRLKHLVSDRAVVEHVAPLLNAIPPPRAQDLVEQAWAILEPLLSLKEHEKAYLAAINEGELRPELIFPKDSEEASRLAQHPAILWKVANVRAHLARKGRKIKRGLPPNQTAES